MSLFLSLSLSLSFSRLLTLARALSLSHSLLLSSLPLSLSLSLSLCLWHCGCIEVSHGHGKWSGAPSILQWPYCQMCVNVYVCVYVWERESELSDAGLCICVSVCICVSICVCVYIYVSSMCLCWGACAYVGVCSARRCKEFTTLLPYLHTTTHSITRWNTLQYPATYFNTGVYIYMHICTYIYINVYIYIDIHIYIEIDNDTLTCKYMYLHTTAQVCAVCASVPQVMYSLSGVLYLSASPKVNIAQCRNWNIRLHAHIRTHTHTGLVTQTHTTTLTRHVM